MTDRLPADDGGGTPRPVPRPAERRLLESLLRPLRRGWGRSVALVGGPGSGKSTVLAAWRDEVFRGGEVLPLLHAFGGRGGDPGAEAAGLAEALVAQALAFRRRDPAMLEAPPRPDEAAAALAAAWPEAAAALAGAAGRDVGPGLREAALLPHRLASSTGVRVLCLYDDLEALAPRVEGGAPSWPAAAVASRVAPAVYACEDELLPGRVLGADAAASVGVARIAPLDDEAARVLLLQLLRAEGAELDAPAREEVVGLAGGAPGAILAIAREAAAAASADPSGVARAYAAAVCRGGVARRARARLAAALPDRAARGRALEVLAFCLRDGEASGADRIAGRMFKGEREVAAAVAGLERAGFARVDCTLVRVVADQPLRDALQALYRVEVAGEDPGVVEAEVAAGAVRSRRARALGRERGLLREALGGIMLAWDGRQVPAALLAAGAATGDAEGDLVTLPRVASVTRGRLGGRSSPATLEADALAYGWRGEPGDPAAEVAWVARLLPGGAGSAGRIAEFEEAVSALQAAGGLPAARLVRWAILDAPPDPAGAALAAERRLAVSTLDGLAEMARLLGVAPPPPAAGPPPPGPELELEMTIPAAAEAESVAARALDQLGENLAMPEPDRDRVRAALVEACINAFEHSGVPGGGRVRITFAVGGGDLRIRVENRGRPLAALPAAADEGEGTRRRGWGLTLIRRLVDEVALEPRDDGVSLVMVKHLKGGDGGRG